MFSYSTAPSNASSSIFGRPPVFGVANRTGDQIAPASVFGGPYGTRSGFNSEQSHFGAEERGSRVADYKKTAVDSSSAEKLVSISAMPAYEAKNHEELRWEDYKSIRKGVFGLRSSAEVSTLSSLSASTSSQITNFSTTSWGPTSISATPVQPNPFGNTFPSTTSWGTSSMSTTPVNPNPWGTPSISSTPVKPNPFGNTFPSVPTDTPTWKFPGPTQTATWNSSGPASTSFFSQPLNFSSSANTSLTNVTAVPSNSFNPFAPRTTVSPPVSHAPSNQNLFTTHMSSWSFSSPAFAASTSCQATAPPSSNAFWSTPIDKPFTSTVTAAVNSALVSPAPLYNIPFINSSVSPMHQLTTTTFPIPKSAALTFSQPSTPPSFNASWSTAIDQSSISFSTQEPANSVWVAPTSSGLNSFNQPTTSFKPCIPSTQNINGEITGVVGKISDSQLCSSQITSMEQPSFAASPFGTLPPKPHIFFEGSKSTQLIHYGISSIPVKDKPAPVRYPMFTTRHLSRRSKMPVRKSDPKLNSTKTPFFGDTTEIPVDVFVPRENPRELVVFQEMWSPRTIKKNIQKEEFSDRIFEVERDDINAYTCKDDPTKDEELFATVLDAPTKLQQLDYYTQPQVSELEAKERAEPGVCSHVKDFVVGRHGYGSIKFLGETDVRKLDLETLIQFNYREVIVYMDESMKPPVGEGLNKPAEITLYNINCVDRRTGVKYVEGWKVDKYTEMLKKKAVAQGVEFVSYDAVLGEWKFRVKHF